MPVEIKRYIKILKELILDTIFPARCVVCGAAGKWWCEACLARTEIMKHDLCPGCCLKFTTHDCPKILKNLNSISVVGYYHDPKLRAIIHALKYKGATCLAKEIGVFCMKGKQERLEPWAWAGLKELAVQHLPGSPKRIRERGFDQALIITKIFQKIIAPWAFEIDVLDRRDALLPQAALEPNVLRKVNVAGCFNLKKGVTVPPYIVLVDDVITTGGTVDEAARVLREHGAKKVFCFALAIGA